MTDFQKWEYETRWIGHQRRVDIEDLQAFGAQGWELVSIAGNSEYGGYYIFKRPILPHHN